MNTVNCAWEEWMKKHHVKKKFFLFLFLFFIVIFFIKHSNGVYGTLTLSELLKK
jgi:hypothetical protein